MYVLSVCRHGLEHDHDVANLTYKSQLEKRTYLECSQGYVLAESKEWLCNTCRLVIKKEQWP